MFDRIAKRIQDAGFDAIATCIHAGQYYDGTDHGEQIPCVRVTVDKRETGYYSSPIEKAIKAAIRGNRRVTFRAVNCNQFYFTYEIAEIEGFARASRLQAIANAFLEAFWQEIHDNPRARDNNAAAAIAAGRARIKGMES